MYVKDALTKLCCSLSVLCFIHAIMGAKPMMNITVLVLVDDELLLPGKSGFVAGAEDCHVVEVLRTMVNEVVVRSYTSVRSLLGLIDEIRPALVFNLTEHSGGDRTKDSHICAVIDLSGVPYTGTGPSGMMLCRDKALSKLVAAHEGFAAPRFFTVNASDPQLPSVLPLPLVVKPRFGDSSEGIHGTSLVRTRRALLKQIAAVRRTGWNAVICEEYIPGRDIFVSIAARRVTAIREFIVGRDAPNAPRLVSAQFKHDQQYRRHWKIRSDFAQLSAEQRRKLNSLALRTFDALSLRDYGRLDLRLTPTGEWFFLEANPNPALVPLGKTFTGSGFGVSLRKVVTQIIKRAVHRKPEIWAP